MGNFLHEHCTFGRDKEVETKTLLEAYNAANPERRLTSKSLKQKMANRGHVIRKHQSKDKNGRFFQGVTLCE